MNYRHAFHAGNFADLLKHAVLLAALAHLKRAGKPVSVFDTHAGAGLYDIGGVEALRSREAQAGIARLMAAQGLPPPLSRLAAEVATVNSGGETQLYPGSPVLTVRAQRPGDRYLGCELRADDHAILTRELRRRAAPGVQAEARLADGYVEAAKAHATTDLLVVDPPFENGDDYLRIATALAARRGAAALAWLPLKDLDTFDRFLTDLEAKAVRSALVVETRLRPLDQPLKMNGCALILTGLDAMEEEARAAAEWIASELGERGADARVWRLA